MEKGVNLLTFESVDKNLWYDHSNETSLNWQYFCMVPFVFSVFYKMKFGDFLSFDI